MKSLRLFFMFSALVGLLNSSDLKAQSPSVLYTWNGTGNLQQWFRSFGAASTSATLSNTSAGTLTIAETSTALGGSQAFSDDFNRVRESPTGPSGGLDLTGLDFLEFDLGHNGASPINVQFYVQATTGSSFFALGPDVAVSPGIGTYQVPLTGLSAAAAVYVRTIGINIRDHAAQGNLSWNINEVRSGGIPNTVRQLATFDTGTAEGGLNGAIVNFGNAGVTGNDGGQNQTGLSQNPAGSGSLQWSSPAGGSGGAVTVGNGTAWNGNSFNNRTTDLSNYTLMHVVMSATEISTSNGGSQFVQAFAQVNNFGTFNVIGGVNLPIDGQFHDLYIPIGALPNMNVVDQLGLNLGNHTDALRYNVDLIEFTSVPEPTSALLLVIGMIGGLGVMRRTGRSGLVG